MSVIGPRPLLVEYLPYYTKEEHHRHDVRPGLSGWAQINGRNAIDSWEQRFQYDLEYVKNVSFAFDIRRTITQVKEKWEKTVFYTGGRSWKSWNTGIDSIQTCVKEMLGNHWVAIGDGE